MMHYLTTIPLVQGHRRDFSTRTRDASEPLRFVYRIAQRQLRRLRRARKQRRGWA